MSRAIMAGYLSDQGELVATLEVTVDHAGYHVALREGKPPIEPWATVRGLGSQREAKTAGLSLVGSFLRARNLHRWGIAWEALP